jgi:hypothetical protein
MNISMLCALGLRKMKSTCDISCQNKIYFTINEARVLIIDTDVQSNEIKNQSMKIEMYFKACNKEIFLTFLKISSSLYAFLCINHLHKSLKGIMT